MGEIDMRSIVEILADNLCSNMETVAENTAARELSELSDQKLRKIGVVRQRSDQGAEIYFWRESKVELTTIDQQNLLNRTKRQSLATSHAKTFFTA